MDPTYHEVMKKRVLPVLDYRHYYTSEGCLCLRENRHTGHCQVFNITTGGLSLDYYSFSNSSGLECKEHKKIAYHGNGRVSSIHHYLGRKQHGESIVYFENGNKKSHEYHENGKLHGIARYYYEDGRLFNEGEFFHGVRTAMTLYHKDGSLRSQQSFHLFHKKKLARR